MKTRQFLKSCLFVFLCSAVAQTTRAENAVVEVMSGRTFRGQILSTTDAKLLWIETQKSGISIARPIDWSRVVAVIIGDERLLADSSKERILGLDWQGPNRQNDRARRPWQSGNGRIEVGPSKPKTVETASLANAAADIDIEPLQDFKIACIRVDATIENWNADTAVDGIRLHLVALNQAGEVVPARGTLQAELIGQGPSNGMNGNPFPVLDQWSEVVGADRPNRHQHILRLPFRGLHPEFPHAHQVGSFGMVHVKLNVAGQGTFEETTAFTRIRPYSPIRDRLEQFYGRRFHPLETASPQVW